MRLLLSKEGLGVGTNYVLGKMDGEGGRRYGEFARSPQSLNDAEVVERHGCEEDFGGVRVTSLRNNVVSVSVKIRLYLPHPIGSRAIFVPAILPTSKPAYTARGGAQRGCRTGT